MHGRTKTHSENCVPDAVAYVNCFNEVEKFVRICARHNCPRIGWGTGTSFQGHTAALRGRVTVNVSLMSKILDANVEDMNAVTEPGVTRQALNNIFSQQALFLLSQVLIHHLTVWPQLGPAGLQQLNTVTCAVMY